MQGTRSLEQHCVHTVDLTGFGPFTVAEFTFADPPRARHHLRTRLLSTVDVDEALRHARGATVDALADLPLYHPVNSALGRVLIDTPSWQLLDAYGQQDPAVLVLDLLTERGETLLRPEDGFRFEIRDHSTWPLPSRSDRPLACVQHVDSLRGSDFDLTRAAAILRDHPWIVKVYDADDGLQHDPARGQLSFDVLLPQLQFTQLVDAANAGRRPGVEPTGVPNLLSQVIWPLGDERPDRPARIPLPDGRSIDADLLGLRPAMLPPERRTAAYEDD